MSNSDFINLHSHSAFSFRDAISQPADIAKRAAELGQTALALTDHGNLHGLIAHAKGCKEAGIKPIFGMEAYEGIHSPMQPGAHKGEKRAYHLTLLAQDLTGWKNLVYLHNRAWAEGFSWNPRIDRAWLEGHTDGLIALSGCLAGRVQYLMVNDSIDAAEEAAMEYADLFRDRFFLEGMNAGIIDPTNQLTVLKQLRAMGKRLGIPLVATNDNHYLIQEQGVAGGTHHIFRSCFGQKDWWKTDQLYLKRPEELRVMDLTIDEIDITNVIGDLCTLDLLAEIKGSMPEAQDLPLNFTEAQSLNDMARMGMEELIPFDEIPALLAHTYRERLDYELNLLCEKGYAGYFLIMADILAWARKEGIPVGPGRGSSGGSLVAFVTGITQIDPIRYDLLFSRFLTPGRNTMPDIDVDVSQLRRGEIIKYIKGHYGSAYQISAFQTFGARAAIRQVCRAADVDFGHIQSLEQALPEMVGEGITIDREIAWLLENQPSFVEVFETLDPDVRTHLRALDGIQQHRGMHAAGIALIDRAQADLVPVVVREGVESVAWDMYDIEDLGFLKIDLLGLRTVDVVVQASEKGGFVPGDIPLDDQETFETLSRGDTIGVFQVERHGFAAMIKSLEPTTIGHVIDAVALYRPGPIDSGMMASYIRRRHGAEPVKAPEGLSQVTKDTYGVLLYQEQVMAAAMVLAGFNETEADDLRKAIGKKKKDVMEQQHEKFVAGMVTRRYKKDLAEAMFADIEKYARYSFNKSHATAYGLIAYWCAFLKTHFPAEFYSMLLNSFEKDKERMAPIISDLRKHKIKLLPPDINQSGDTFDPVDGAVRFGLIGVKGLGEAGRKAIRIERVVGGDFESFEDFCRRLPSVPIDKKEALIQAGAFDNQLDKLWAKVDRPNLLVAARQINEGTRRKNPKPYEAKVAPDDKEMAALEREVLGFYVRYDPYGPIRNVEGEDKLAGIIVKVKKHKDKNGNLMAFLDMETPDDGIQSIVMFASLVEKTGIPTEGGAYLCYGSADSSRGRDSFIAARISPIPF